MKLYVLAIFDTHAGHKLGLLNPDTHILEEGPNGELKYVPVKLNAYQEYLWNDLFEPAMGRIKQITEGHKLLTLHGGDLTQGNKFTEQVNTTSEYNQILMAYHNLKPIAELPACVWIRIAAGTGVHEFTEHSAPMMTAELLRARHPKVDTQVNFQGLATVQNKTIDYAHHGPGEGIRIYLNGNNVRYYLSDLIIRCLSLDTKPPDLVLRGHVHGDQDETFHIGNYYSRIMVIPSMCGMSYHGRKVTRSRFIVTNGFALFEFSDGKLSEVWKFYRRDDVRTKETFE